MTIPTAATPSRHLPVRSNLKLLYLASLLVVLLLDLVSLAALLLPEQVYPTNELRKAFLANDLVNLVVGMPILLGSMWLARRGNLAGLLCWPGALLFAAYNAVAYVFALPLGWAFLLNLVLLALTSYTLIALVAYIDGPAVQERLRGRVPARLAGGVLVGLALLFLIRNVGVMVGGIANQTPMPRTELAVLVADALAMPAWIVGGWLLWRRQALGYVAGAGLLFQGSMLFVGLIAFLLLQPIMTDAPFAPVDVAVVAVMGLVCFIPFGLCLRGIASPGNPPAG